MNADAFAIMRPREMVREMGAMVYSKCVLLEIDRFLLVMNL